MNPSAIVISDHNEQTSDNAEESEQDEDRAGKSFMLHFMTLHANQ